jgi:hypothetical protein
MVMIEQKEPEDDISLTIPDDLKLHLGSEVFILCCQLIRYNKYGWKNVRTMVLT